MSLVDGWAAPARCLAGATSGTDNQRVRIPPLISNHERRVLLSTETRLGVVVLAVSTVIGVSSVLAAGVAPSARAIPARILFSCWRQLWSLVSPQGFPQMTTTLTQLKCPRSRHGNYAAGSHVAPSRYEVWGFALGVSKQTRAGPLPPQALHPEKHADESVLHIDPSLLKLRDMLGGAVLHQKRMLRITLQSVLQLRIILVCNV